MGKIGSIVLIIIFILVLGFAVWCYFFRSCSSTEPKKTTSSSTICEDELKTFSGEQVKLSFKYPSSWGEALEKVVAADDESDDVVAAGKTFQITFSKNPYLTISGASPDFEAGGIGGACPIRQYFNGEDEEYQCASIEDTSGKVVSCEEVTIDEQDAVSYYYIPDTECTILGFEKIVLSPIPDEQFPGFVIEMRTVRSDDLDMVDLGERIASGTGINIPYLQGLLTKIQDEVVDEFESGSSTDYLSKLQIQEFDALVESIQFAD